LCCVFFLSFNKTIAQINFSVGAKAGINASWIGNNSTPQNTNSNGFLIGYTGGVWGRINFSDKEESGFFVQPELVISQMGSKSVTTTDTGISTVRNTNSRLFNLVELPIMAGYRINLGEDIDLRFYGGPSFARILNAKDKTRSEATLNGGGTSSAAEKTQDITEDVKPYWTSLQLGVGANFNRFNVDLRFQRVMTAMYMNSVSDESKAMAFQLTLGYKIF
jgi:hypothetical protein